MKLGDLINPEQHAIEILNMFLQKQCDLERTKFAYDANEVFEAVRMARNALEKQKNVLERLEAELHYAESEKKRCVEEDPLQFDRADGYAHGLYNAIEIIKGELL